VKKDSAPKLETNRSSQPQQNAWKTWHDLPAQVPDSVIKLQKGSPPALAPEDYPGIRLKKPESTGPPLSFDLFEKTKGVPYDKAVRAFLIGPDSRIIAKYSKSPDGRYLLDLPSGTELPAGRYQVRLVIDGSEAQVIRSISFLSEPSEPHGNTAGPGNIKVYVTKEALEGKLPRTTFDTDLAGEKFLKSGMDQIDRAVVHYKEDYEKLDYRSSYDLRWNTTLKYARALHDAVLWYRYDSAADALMLFEKLSEEYKASSSKWFWQPKLTDIGIKEADINEPLRNLQALELQKLYVDYSLKRAPTDLGKLTSSLSSFTDRFLSDEAALSTRLTVDRSEHISDLARLKGALQKLERPVLVDLDDGDFLVANIALDKGNQIRAILDPLDTALHKSDRLSAK
jgi:hypothetical protein